VAEPLAPAWRRQKLTTIIFDLDRFPARKRAMAGQGLRERNKADKLQRIVAAAGELFRRQGFEATTGRQICERAGVGTGTLFLYVRDKRELLFLIFEPLAEQTFARNGSGLAADETFVDGLMRVFGAFIRLYSRHPRLARLFVQELFFRADQSPGMVALNGRLRDLIEQMIRTARDRGELRSEVDDAAAGAAVAAHYAYWIQLWLGLGIVSRNQALAGLRNALELQVQGLGRNVGRRAGRPKS
jgi:AcrR family transcriptional regulator